MSAEGHEVPPVSLKQHCFDLLDDTSPADTGALRASALASVSSVAPTRFELRYLAGTGWN